MKLKSQQKKPAAAENWQEPQSSQQKQAKIAGYVSEETITQNAETGEISKTINTKARYFERSDEPHFVKFYVEHLLEFFNIKGASVGLLCMMLQEMNYQNEITINTRFKEKFRERFGLSQNKKTDTIRSCLSKLERRGLIKKLAWGGVYMVNPKIFGKGDFRDIKKLQASFDYMSGEFQTTTEASGLDSMDDKKQIQKNLDLWESLKEEEDTD